MPVFSPSSPFSPPSTLQCLVATPVRLLFYILYHLLLLLRGSPYAPPKNFKPVKVVCISDTHCKNPLSSVPPGDILIHAGDLSNLGTRAEIQRQIDWLKSIHGDVVRGGFSHIIVICGNHDSYFDPKSRSSHDRRQEGHHSGRGLDWGPVVYLQNNSTTVTVDGNRSLNVYGAPQIPKCGGREFAFQYPRSDNTNSDIKGKVSGSPTEYHHSQDVWSHTIPPDVDILITHTPPKTHLDIPLGPQAGLGCASLLRECWRVKPSLHVFGHIHSGHGVEYAWWDEAQRLHEWICASKTSGGLVFPFSFISEALHIRLWIQGSRMLYHAIKSLLWVRVWNGGTTGQEGGGRGGGGGGSDGGAGPKSSRRTAEVVSRGSNVGGSIMVNAALTYQTGDQLGNPPIVVYL